MTSNALQLNLRLVSSNLMSDDEVDLWLQKSERGNAGEFYAGDPNAVYQAVQQVSKLLVEKYLNHPSPDAVPLRLRTKICILLNNFALYPPMRQAVFNCLDGLTQTFEKAISDEGKMPFDQTLGRMSEHVLVLLMRVMNYKLTASAVHEFAEGNVQFSIQLLIAILLKEPKYETDLQFNCISGLLGFTQPQAFFSEDPTTIKEHDCSAFTSKVTFMMDLMLRLGAVRVLSDVLNSCILNMEEAKVCAAMMNTMKMVMNIFKFGQSSDVFSTLQWRQHILLSTNFMDETAIMFAHGLSGTLDDAIHNHHPIPPTVLPGLSLTFKFGAFCSYHLGDAAVVLRLCSTFFHDLFHLPLHALLGGDAAMQQRTMEMYVNLLHFMCNVDALEGDDFLPKQDLLPELSSHALRRSLDRFFHGQLGSAGMATVQAWHRHFLRTDTSIMVAYESTTYQTIDALFAAVEAEQSAGSGAQSAAAVADSTTTSKRGLLGDLPSLKNTSKGDKVSINEAAKLAKTSEKTGKANRTIDASQNSCFCALTKNPLKNPVTSPYGHTFEKADIMRWLEENGSICPITGKSLSASDLKPNAEIASLVMLRAVQESMASKGDDDLYDFS